MTERPALFVMTPEIVHEEDVRAIARALDAEPSRIGVIVRTAAPAICMQIARICAEHESRCFLKADAALVASCGASGVHLGAIAVGVAAPLSAFTASAHDDEETRRAAHARAIFVSPIFATPDKGAPRGVSAIASARKVAPRASIYALGGVGLAEVGACIDAGADGVAVIRAVLGASDPGAAARSLVDAVLVRRAAPVLTGA